jgi:hypothetical protein
MLHSCARLLTSVHDYFSVVRFRHGQPERGQRELQRALGLERDQRLHREPHRQHLQRVLHSNLTRGKGHGCWESVCITRAIRAHER